MNKKKSFLIHIDSLDILDDLTNEQCGELFKAIKSHHYDQEIDLCSIVRIAFSPFKNQFLRDDEKYQKTCERRAVAGSMGGKQKVANLAIASKSKQSVANVADNKNKNDNKKDNDSKNKEIKRKTFSKPIPSEINQFAFTEKLNLEGFFDFYESNGWKVGKNPMKDWKAAARGWSKRQSNYSNQQDFDDTSTDWAVKVADRIF